MKSELGFFNLFGGGAGGSFVYLWEGTAFCAGEGGLALRALDG